MNYQNAQFHMSLPCANLEETRQFYLTDLGFEAGRSGDGWTDVNFFGNQITFKQTDKINLSTDIYIFEGQRIPTFHIGVLINEKIWDFLYQRFYNKGFLKIDKTVFLRDKTGEHISFFLADPNGYTLEFKCFTYSGEVFE